MLGNFTLLAGLMRVIYVMCVALLGVRRVDTSLLPAACDSPYYCFAAFALRLDKANSPLLLAAVDMLNTAFCAAARTRTARSSPAPRAPLP